VVNKGRSHSTTNKAPVMGDDPINAGASCPTQRGPRPTQGMQRGITHNPH